MFWQLYPVAAKAKNNLDQVWLAVEYGEATFVSRFPIIRPFTEKLLSTTQAHVTRRMLFVSNNTKHVEAHCVDIQVEVLP